MMVRRFLFVVLLASGYVYSPLAAAHRQHISWTGVEWNQETRNLEVVHRIHEHDAQLLLAWQLDKPVDLTRLQDRALFAIYVEDHFKLLITDNDELAGALKLLGAELEDSYILVFQEPEK